MNPGLLRGLANQLSNPMSAPLLARLSDRELVLEIPMFR